MTSRIIQGVQVNRILSILLMSVSFRPSRTFKLAPVQSVSSFQRPGFVTDISTFPSNWSATLAEKSSSTDLVDSPRQDLSLRKEGQFFLFRQFPMGRAFETLGTPDVYDTAEVSQWDDLDLIVLVGRTNNKERRNSRKKIIRTKPIYISKQRRVGPSYTRSFKTTTTTTTTTATTTATTTEDPVSLHNLAGPPYHHNILPNSTFLVFEDEFPSIMQYLPSYAASSAHLKTTIANGRNILKNYVGTTKASLNTTSSPPRTRSDHSAELKSSGTKEERSIQVIRKVKQKFSEDPAYTFDLEDAVDRNYPPKLKSLQSQFARRHSKGKKSKEPIISATVGYPNNSWQRINRKVFLGL